MEVLPTFRDSWGWGGSPRCNEVRRIWVPCPRLLRAGLLIFPQPFTNGTLSFNIQRTYK